MKWKRMPPAAIAAIVFAACYALTIGIVLLLETPHPALALGLVALAVPGTSLLVVWRTRKREDLTPKQKAVITGFLCGTAAGFPVAVLMMSSPIALLFLGLPTVALALAFDIPFAPIRTSHAVLQVLLFNPYVLFALNCSLIGSAVGWILVVTREAPTGARWPLARRRLALALGFLLGPAVGFGAGVGLMYQYEGLEGWRGTWGPVTCAKVVSSEYEAVRGLVEIARAQETYRRLKGGKTYAASLSLLHEGVGDRTGLIDGDLARARYRARSGYLFVEIPLDGEGSPVDPATDFAVCAFPVYYKRTGRNTFFISTEGDVYQKDAVGPMLKLPNEAEFAHWLPVGNE